MEEILQSEVLLAILVAKLNDRTRFKDNLFSKPSSHCPMKKKVEYWGIHIETVKSEQVKIKRAIYYILAHKILSWIYGMELHFMPHIRYNMDSKQKQRLHNAMMKYKHMLANLVEFKLVEFEKIDSPN